MSRWVVPSRAGVVADGPERQDNLLARIAKYVPAEIVSVYTLIITGLTAAKATPEHIRMAAIGLIVFFLLVTVGYIWRSATGASRTAHYIVSPIAFVAWAYPISSAALGDFFWPLAALLLQALVLGLSIVIAPRES
ncbi:MAG: hypothetical protein EOO82_02055 [Oxalobacteraceae bacterium]|nr:MAG: hypothetical protein EOO82_02055 [Oxalobacteraceae bacterium]